MEILSQVFLPLSLAIIMFGMGMTLVPLDFSRIVKFPKAVFLGLFNQLILLPLVGFGLVMLFDLEPIMAIGVMVLAACPGGVTSNLITQICKGNIALSVTLTAIASVVSIFTIPFILSESINYFGTGTGTKIELPIVATILQIMAITIVPISLGMLVKNRKSDFATRMEKPMRTASTVIFILVFIAVIAANFSLMGEAMKRVGVVTLLLNVGTMAIGYFSARLLKLDVKSAITITVESGIQNGTLAFVVVTTILNNIEMGIPAGAYSVWMFVTGGILMMVLGRRKEVKSERVGIEE
ncbi:MAG: BASS family bile acid:Na+ symporter [Luteibaculaceae bacterium]|jgi:BASS family bile acid:Na+ symporter